MKAFLLLVIFVSAIMLLNTCSDPASSDRDNAITMEYLKNYPRAEGTAVVCKTKALEARQFVRCTLLGSAGETDIGLWEAQKVGSGSIYYALNGKAQMVLQYFQDFPSLFQTHPHPTEIDITAVLDNFSGATKPVLRQNVIAAMQSMSAEEQAVYCGYQKEADALSETANRLNLQAGSDKRQRWIDPRLLALRDQHFAKKGLDFDGIEIKAIKALIVCPQ